MQRLLITIVKNIHLPTKLNLCSLITLSGWVLKNSSLPRHAWCPFLFLNWAWEVQKRRKCVLLGASQKQFGNAVVGNAFSTDGYTNKKLFMQNWCTTTYLKVPSHSIFLCFAESRRPSLSPLQSVPIRPNSVMSRVERRWPILDSVMGDRIIQHPEETCNIFRQTVKSF